MSDIGPLSVRTTVVAASVAVPPWEERPTISGVGSDVVAFPVLGVAQLVDSGTDLEDELSTPDVSPSTDAVKPGEVVHPEICPAPWSRIAFDLVKALLEVSVLPPMVTPIVDPVVESLGTRALYPEPPLPVLSVDEQVPVLESVDEQVPVLVSSPFREAAGSPVLDDSQSYRASPTGSGYEPITSPISPSLRTAAVSRPPSGLATMGQYLQRDSALLVEESTDLPLLPIPLTPRPIVEEMVLGSAVGSPTGEPVAAPSPSMPDLSREGPFDEHQDASESGASPRVLDSLPVCQYRMTSYDEDNNRSDFSPAYSIHLHDPRLLEYVGAPESAP